MVVTVPLKTVSEFNRHELQRARQRRHTSQRDAVVRSLDNAIANTVNVKPTTPCLVSLTRVNTRSLGLDRYHLEGCFKAIRNSIADWLGSDSNSPEILWEYSQRLPNDGEADNLVIIEIIEGKHHSRDELLWEIRAALTELEAGDIIDAEDRLLELQ